MDWNILVKKLRMNLGLNGILRDAVSDADIEDIVMVKTIPTFSRYFSHCVKLHNFTLNEKLLVSKESQIYRLPKPFVDVIKNMEGMEILSLMDITPNRDAAVDFSGIPNGMFYSSPNMGMYAGNAYIAGGYARASVEMFREALNVIYIDPYMIKFNMEYRHVMGYSFNMDFRVTHPNNLSTIRGSYAETFEELATLDCKITLWANVIGFLNSLQVGSGTIDLKKDEWQSAESERKELVQKFKEQLIIEYPTVIVV